MVYSLKRNIGKISGDVNVNIDWDHDFSSNCCPEKFNHDKIQSLSGHKHLHEEPVNYMNHTLKRYL